MIRFFFSFRLNPRTLNETVSVPINSPNINQLTASNDEIAFVIPTHTVPAQSEVLVEMTTQRRALFLLFGIGYFFVGGGAIVMEILIIVYSYSSFYRGLWTGNLMLATGVVLVIASGRKSQSFSVIVNLLLFNLSTITAGICFSSVETITTKSCDSPDVQHICDSETGKILKLAIVGELNFAMLYSMVVISYIWHIKGKAEPQTPRAESYRPH